MPHTKPQVLESLLAGNEAFANHFSRDEPVLLKQLAAGQHPKILWIGWWVSQILYFPLYPTFADLSSSVIQYQFR